MTEYVLAAFKITETRSVAYLRRKTLDSFLLNLKTVMEIQKPDYVSIRVIRECQKSETDA